MRQRRETSRYAARVVKELMSLVETSGELDREILERAGVAKTQLRRMRTGRNSLVCQVESIGEALGYELTWKKKNADPEREGS